MKHALYLSLLLLIGNSQARAQEEDGHPSKKIQEIVVVGSKARGDNLLSPQMGAVTFSAEEVAKRPSLFGEPDLLRFIQQEAGVSGGVEGKSGLLVRGGQNDENLFLLHHLPLYSVTHLGGLFSSFNMAAVDRVAFLKTCFPASYGGRLSSITDVTLRQSDYNAFQGQATIGMLAGSLMLTCPLVKDRLAIIVGMRRSWSQYMLDKVVTETSSLQPDEDSNEDTDYVFADANLKLDYRLGRSTSGYAHFYYGYDDMEVEGVKTRQTGSEESYTEDNAMLLKWVASGTAMGLTYTPDSVVEVHAHAYLTHYSSLYNLDNDRRYGSTYDYNHKKDENGLTDAGISASAGVAATHWLSLKAGLDATYHRYRPEHITLESNDEGTNVLTGTGSPVVHANETALWTDNTIKMGRSLNLMLGLRWVGYASEGGRHSLFEPRASACLSLSETASLKASYMRGNQFVQQVPGTFISLSTDAWLPTAGHWKPKQSDQVSAGLYVCLPQLCDFVVEGYYKWLRGLLEYKDGVSLFTETASWTDKLTQGDGHAYGADISLSRVYGRLTGNISYGLMWNYRHFDTLNGGRTFPAKYDNRHKLNINAMFQLSKSWEFGMGWTYATGNRLTLALDNYQDLHGAGFTSLIAPLPTGRNTYGIGYYEERNNVRLPAYHRMDMSATYSQHYRNGWEGRWTLSIYNVYNRKNPIAVTKEGMDDIWRGDGRWITRFHTYGFMSIVPSLSYTLKI